MSVVSDMDDMLVDETEYTESDPLNISVESADHLFDVISFENEEKIYSQPSVSSSCEETATQQPDVTRMNIDLCEEQQKTQPTRTDFGTLYREKGFLWVFISGDLNETSTRNRPVSVLSLIILNKLDTGSLLSMRATCVGCYNRINESGLFIQLLHRRHLSEITNIYKIRSFLPSRDLNQHLTPPKYVNIPCDGNVANHHIVNVLPRSYVKIVGLTLDGILPPMQKSNKFPIYSNFYSEKTSSSGKNDIPATKTLGYDPNDITEIRIFNKRHVVCNGYIFWCNESKYTNEWVQDTGSGSDQFNEFSKKSHDMSFEKMLKMKRLYPVPNTGIKIRDSFPNLSTLICVGSSVPSDFTFSSPGIYHIFGRFVYGLSDTIKVIRFVSGEGVSEHIDSLSEICDYIFEWVGNWNENSVSKRKNNIIDPYKIRFELDYKDSHVSMVKRKHLSVPHLLSPKGLHSPYLYVLRLRMFHMFGIKNMFDPESIRMVFNMFRGINNFGVSLFKGVFGGYGMQDHTSTNFLKSAVLNPTDIFIWKETVDGKTHVRGLPPIPIIHMFIHVSLSNERQQTLKIRETLQILFEESYYTDAYKLFRTHEVLINRLNSRDVDEGYKVIFDRQPGNIKKLIGSHTNMPGIVFNDSDGCNPLFFISEAKMFFRYVMFLRFDPLLKNYAGFTSLHYQLEEYGKLYREDPSHRNIHSFSINFAELLVFSWYEYVSNSGGFLLRREPLMDLRAALERWQPLQHVGFIKHFYNIVYTHMQSTYISQFNSVFFHCLGKTEDLLRIINNNCSR